MPDNVFKWDSEKTSGALTDSTVDFIAFTYL